MSNAFLNNQIDTKNENLENYQVDAQTEEEKDEKKKLKNMIVGKDII